MRSKSVIGRDELHLACQLRETQFHTLAGATASARTRIADNLRPS
jgi:hypothetical protein